MSTPSAFQKDIEQLCDDADAWEPSAHPPRATVELLGDLTRALRHERAHRATSAELLRQSNLAYGRLESKATLRRNLGIFFGALVGALVGGGLGLAIARIFSL